MGMRWKRSGQIAVGALKWSSRCLDDHLNFDKLHLFKYKVWPPIFAKDDFGMGSLMQARYKARYNLCLGNFQGRFPRCKLANILG